MVLIQGSVPSDADRWSALLPDQNSVCRLRGSSALPHRFQVDLTCGNSVKPRADVAFHFNPRFGRSPSIVCNTLQNQRWGREEVSHQRAFSVGSAFEIIILVLRDQFKVIDDQQNMIHWSVAFMTTPPPRELVVSPKHPVWFFSKKPDYSDQDWMCDSFDPAGWSSFSDSSNSCLWWRWQ